MVKAARGIGFKASKGPAVNAAQPADRDQAQRIREQAYRLWEKRGRVQGKDLEIWLEAERAVKNTQN